VKPDGIARSGGLSGFLQQRTTAVFILRYIFSEITASIADKLLLSGFLQQLAIAIFIVKLTPV